MVAPHVPELLSRMIRTVALDSAAIGRRHPALMRSLQAGCAVCQHVDFCRRSLDDGSARYTHADFCLNAPVLSALEVFASVAEQDDVPLNEEHLFA